MFILPILFEIGNTLVAINSASTIFIYYMFSSKYRNIVAMLSGRVYDRSVFAPDRPTQYQNWMSDISREIPQCHTVPSTTRTQLVTPKAREVYLIHLFNYKFNPKEPWSDKIPVVIVHIWSRETWIKANLENLCVSGGRFWQFSTLDKLRRMSVRRYRRNLRNRNEVRCNHFCTNLANYLLWYSLLKLPSHFHCFTSIWLTFIYWLFAFTLLFLKCWTLYSNIVHA